MGTEAVEVIQNRSGKFWLGTDGIIRVLVTPNADRTTRDAVESLAAVDSLCRGGRHPILADIKKSQSPTTRDERQLYVNSETTKLISALALVVESPLSRIIASMFLGISKLPCPTKVFFCEEKAAQWLLGFVENSGADNTG